MRSIASIFLAGAMAAMLVNDFAEAATCYTMQAELAHLQEDGAGGSGSRARYERAFREQANVLARTESRARNAGCFGRGFLLSRRKPDASCANLLPKISEMQGNLARLDKQRRRGGGGNSRRIRELQRAIRARECGVPGRDSFEAPGRRRSASNEYGFGRGTYRTLCVRPCDGYYFPISYSTTQDKFPEDARACDAMCPGMDARLYMYRNPGGVPEDMIAIDGGRYVDLEAAFKFRTSFASSCACRPASGMTFAGDPNARPTLDIALPEDNTALLPRPRPAPGEDPETLANRAGNYLPRAATAPAEPALTASTSDGRRIRVVGPLYWGDTSQDDVVVGPVPN